MDVFVKVALIMIYILLIFITFILSSSKKGKVKVSNINFHNIYTFIWATIGLISLVHGMQIVEVSITIHLYIILSIIVFNFIFLVFRKQNIKVSKFSAKKFSYEVNYTLRYKMIIALNIIFIILIAPYTVAAIRHIMNYGFSTLRGTMYSMQSDIARIICRNIPSALFNVTVLFAADNLVNKRKELLIIAIIDIIIYTITYAGRFMIFYFIIYYFASYIITKNHNVRLKIKRRYYLLGILGLLAISSLRSSRSIIESAVMYFVGPLSFLQYIIDNPASFGLKDGLTFGYLTFGFIFEPVMGFIKSLANINVHMPSYYFNIYAQPQSNIGISGHIYNYNNNTTMFYPFIRDFGIWGIIIGTVFLSLFAAILTSKYQNNRSSILKYLMIFLYGVIIVGVMEYSMMSVWASLEIILIFCFVRRKQTDICQNKY